MGVTETIEPQPPWHIFIRLILALSQALGLLVVVFIMNIVYLFSDYLGFTKLEDLANQLVGGKKLTVGKEFVAGKELPSN